MKLNKLTKEQRVSIEKNHFYIELNCWINSDPLTYGCGVFMTLKQEIKRIIKRIDDEIEFLDRVEDNLINNYATYDMYGDLRTRIDKLKKQKELYELMEQLE